MSKKDLRRLVDGVSLILLESSKRVPKPQTLISQSLKSILDLAGLTKGTPRPLHPTSSSSSSSIVQFDHDTKGSTFASGEVKSPILDAKTSTFAASGEEKTPLPASDGAGLGEKDANFDPKNSTFAAPGEEKTPLPASDGANLGEKDSNLDPKSSTFSVSEDKTPVPSSDLYSDGGAAIVENSEHQKPLESVVKRQRRRPRERRVPSTPIGRALGFAGLGAGLAWGTIQESAKRIAFGSENAPASPFLSEQNAERLAVALCRMRGAALKLGQMLSIQDESVIPAPILSALDIVRQGADVMPRSQLNEVLDSELGPDWSKKLKSFDYEPLAAASIGQVHRAVTRDGLEVAMKIQYPGVANSIDSDIDNAKRLLDYTNLIPKGLFLDRAIKVAKEELARECEYELEAASQKRFRHLLSNMDGVYVPMVVDDISSKRVLTTELVSGIPIDKVVALNQETRNYVGRKLLEVSLKELFVFRFMQTDPNWSNFLYDENTNTINLIDFGASRGYRKEFVDDYLRMVLACANRDRDVVIEMSTRLEFLTGEESEVMLDAHVQASFIVGLPFSTSEYDFRASNITSSVSHLGATMLKHRLTPPPDEAYSLHRKLSGAFLACIKLGAIIPCRDLLLQVYQQYDFSDNNEDTLSSATS